MFAGTAARLFPVGFSVSGTHEFRNLWVTPSLSLSVIFRVDGVFGPALDLNGAEEGWTGMSKQEAGRGRSYVRILFELCWSVSDIVRAPARQESDVRSPRPTGTLRRMR